MTNPSVTFHTADETNIDRIEALLKENGLPYQDIRANSECFVSACADGEFIGTGGVEVYGSDGLLRSVVVIESHRGQGYGVELCDALEDYARTNDVERLYLLTTTAAPFFRQCGYEEVARETTPASIRQTTQFTDLCPNSATCLRKRL